MKRYFSIITILLALNFLQSCENENNPNLLEVYWDQTGCADPWATNSSQNENDLINAIEEYLATEGVIGAKVISIKNEASQANCLACFCTTGIRFFVAAPKDQLDKLLELGFQRKS
ncbi:hypothetical protein [Algoriphagus sp.]|uniref:hypothetical protein n=1 Tax=Algoriphagus sp. TaxID=1872435 RepID=UPI0025DD1018|nr:hypothetical protein [Algoriphagus sp.]